MHQVVAAAEHPAGHDEAPSHAYILDPTVKLLVCHDAYLFYEKVKCINRFLFFRDSQPLLSARAAELYIIMCNGLQIDCV